MITVELENITKTFGKTTAVDGLSLSVPDGSIYGFIGPNGSGKTTTLRMIMNIFYPDSDAIRLFGETYMGAFNDRIGYLPEERGLYKKMKVREILQFYGELKSGRNVDREVDRWLEKLDLAGSARKKVETLSKGMSQKVQFIAAVVTYPELVILDEPFSGLDPVNMEVLRDSVLELQARGTTVIFSTHDMNVAETMCDFIFMIFKGKKLLGGVGVALTASSVYIVGGIISVKYMGLAESVPYGIIPWYFGYLILALFMYGSVFAAMGSACSDSKDVQSLALPAMLPLIFCTRIFLNKYPDSTVFFSSSLRVFVAQNRVVWVWTKKNPATTYSPTRSPKQYHRRK